MSKNYFVFLLLYFTRTRSVGWTLGIFFDMVLKFQINYHGNLMTIMIILKWYMFLWLWFNVRDKFISCFQYLFLRVSLLIWLMISIICKHSIPISSLIVKLRARTWKKDWATNYSVLNYKYVWRINEPKKRRSQLSRVNDLIGGCINSLDAQYKVSMKFWRLLIIRATSFEIAQISLSYVFTYIDLSIRIQTNYLKL